MASFKKQPEHKFSRVKNDLAELQRWWPIHIKDDGVLGISCDPVLYRTDFSESTTATDDESVQAGIRVEAIQDDGTDVTGTEPTIVIENSGTHNATCKINHSDGTTTVIRLVAPTWDSSGGAGSQMLRTQTTDGTTFTSNTIGSTINDNGGHKSKRGGPNPVFMTVQELAEAIDTYRHIGLTNDSSKKAFVPHQMYDNVHSSPAAWVTLPAINEDPRVAVSATDNVVFPTTSPYRATVFMPMMLDNNQFSKNISGAQTLIGNQSLYNVNGITRYDSQPDGEDSSTIEYKIFGESGDHKLGVNAAGIRGDNSQNGLGTMNQDMAWTWSSQDSSECPPPKYRMAMALAAFLKDGTYSLNNGVIIPYVYDADRTIGGKNSDTMYMRWQGDEGIAADSNTLNGQHTAAGVWPFFDFIQGPISPRAQGSNWTASVLTGHDGKALHMEVPPNTKRNDVKYIEVVQVGDRRLLRVYVEKPSSTNENRYHGVDLLEVGDAIFLENVSGNLGTGRDMTLEEGRVWGSRYDARRKQSTDGSSTTGGRDCNGWWVISAVSLNADDTAIPTDQVRYEFNVRNLQVTAGYAPTTGTCCQGRIGGPQMGAGTTLYEKDSDGTEADGANDFLDLANTYTGSLNNLAMPMGGYTHFPEFFTGVPSANPPPASKKIGTFFQAGMNQGDLNVPPASSRNDTYPARPTIGEVSIVNAAGEFIGDRPVPRSISIQTLGVAPAETIPNAPIVVSSGNGSLRLPAPLGHDLCLRYENTSIDGRTTGATAKNLSHTRWRVRFDVGQTSIGDSAVRHGGPDKWAWRGVSTPLWSYMDGLTGKHAWDEIKPTGWLYGRNRAWPAHERMGTRLSMSPSLLPNNRTTYWTQPSGDFVAPNQETTKIGLSEIGCSPIFLDMQMTAFIPKKNNRMSIIEFDMNEADEVLGRHHMIYETNNRDMGFGFKPMWNGTGNAGVFTSVGFKTIAGDDIDDPNVAVIDDMIEQVIDPALDNVAASGHTPQFSGFPVDETFGMPNAELENSYSPEHPYPLSNSSNRPAVWFAPDPTHWTGNTWQNSETFTWPSEAGFGRMGTGFGYGEGFSYSEGINTVRAIFTRGGMTCVFNGETIGTDPSAQEAVWGLQIKACNVFVMADRTPFFVPPSGETEGLVKGNNVVYPVYSHLSVEEPLVILQVNNDIYKDAGVDTARTVSDRFMTAKDSANNPESTYADVTDHYPTMMPQNPTLHLDTAGRMTRADNPAIQVSNVDLQIDEIILRQIPTPAMLPFTVDTLKQQATGIASGLARYTSLLIEADNIDKNKGMKVTVTLLEPPTISTIAQEASTVITGFDNLDPDFLGGVGEVDLTGLPQTAVDNGFVIRFNFFVPSSEDTALHPIDWSKTPIIRNYQVFFDHKPTADNEIIGNTYDGSTASTIGTSTIQTFTTKVGHIVSMRLHGDTTDPDRKITHLKADMGDGTITEWLPIETPDGSVTLDISHVYSSRPTGGTYDIKVYARDDNENDSDFVLTPNNFIRVTIIAGEPVAVVRAVPSMVRAGQAIRFDGSDSYAIDTGATITDYAWTFGDGSTGVNGTTVYQDHTYANAGEFLATLIVTDSTGSVSPVAKAVVKVLPATLVVPLTLSTKPSSFSRTRTATFTTTPILDAVYPEITDMGQRADEFTMTGMFLKETQETDIAFMEELLLSGALVEFEYQEVNYTGTADSKTFVGRMISFDYNREGGSIDKTPYTATFVREAGLGA